MPVRYGIPTPVFSASLAYYDTYRNAVVPANLLQAQRDFFGAHTFERVDEPAGQFFHIEWSQGRKQIRTKTFQLADRKVITHLAWSLILEYHSVIYSFH